MAGSGDPKYTKCQFQNHAGQDVKVDSQKNWNGNGDAPTSIQDQQPEATFDHTADSEGSIGGVAYVADKFKWIIAWSNAKNVPSNKVYTEIIKVDKVIDWDKIKESLENSEEKSSDHNKFGYSSDASIEKISSQPTMTAKLSQA